MKKVIITIIAITIVVIWYYWYSYLKYKEASHRWFDDGDFTPIYKEWKLQNK